MPTCCVINCKNKSGRGKEKINMFSFPQKPELRKQWLEACKQTHTSKQYVICQRHFLPECIEEKMTQQHSGRQLRLMRRVKRNAVPTEFLDLPKERKRSRQKEKENQLSIGNAPMPSYNDLLSYAKRFAGTESAKQEEPMMNEHNQSLECAETGPLSEQTNNNVIAMLLHRLETLEEEKKQADLKIAQFSEEIVQLKKNFKEMLTNNAKIIANLSEKNKELHKNLAETRKTDSEIASDTLRIVFTPGQIRKLTSSKNKRA
ncbi:PREDICTED: uncharacterized protein LOC108778281 [Cyphomyrmex costatus]|uniref:uncharacterized protein LOC108778281 n=1 Tax=Cyphomyrmex costatus TaxID=456900 RepID=UPI000852348B|nr:PREDICTED: uncharacterized protein LOC108778281 [Cyphomyrmex costatus]